jgi:transcriptional regulator with XRE-family HTH domain
MATEARAARRREAQAHALVLGAVIAQLRERRHLTQSELAKRAATTQPTLSRIERGQLQPDPFLLRNLAAGLNLTTEELDRLIEDAYARTAQAAKKTLPKKKGSMPWWQVALAAAGVVGFAGLVAFIVSAVVNESEEKE